MVFLRTLLGAAVGSILTLTAFRIIPFTPDLTDWGGRTFPREYLFPLMILVLTGYLASWIGSRFSPSTGRLCGIFASIFTLVIIIGFGFSANIIEPLFHHPAYPVFSDHVLLAVALLLVAGHLGGLRTEKVIHASPSPQVKTT